MGCDIHAHIEMQLYRDRGEPRWCGFAALQYEPRHYSLFAALTNGEVRYYDEKPLNTIAPRGYPYDASSDTDDDYYETGYREVEPGTAEREAETWRATVVPMGGTVDVFRSRSQTWGFGEPHDGATDHTSLHARWPCPDWHTPSWLTTDEFRAALRTVTNSDDYWNAVLAAMAQLDANGTPARLVFWFDN